MNRRYECDACGRSARQRRHDFDGGGKTHECSGCGAYLCCTCLDFHEDAACHNPNSGEED